MDGDNVVIVVVMGHRIHLALVTGVIETIETIIKWAQFSVTGTIALKPTLQFQYFHNNFGSSNPDLEFCATTDTMF